MNAREWVEKGVAFGKSGWHEEALRAFDRAIELDPRDAAAWYNKGNALDELKRYEDAIAAYEKAIEIDPGLAAAWNNKGVALYELERYEEAIAAYDRAIEIDPRYAAAWNNKGITLERIGKYEPAIEAYTQCINLKPEDALPRSNLAEVFFKLCNYIKASEIIHKALEMNENFPQALVLKGRLKIEEKKYDEAIGFFNRAISSAPAHPIPILWKVYARYLNVEASLNPENLEGKRRYYEEMAAIIRELERAKKIPQFEKDKTYRAQILYFLGCFYYKCGDIISACHNFEENLKYDRENKLAKEILGHIWNYKIKPTWWRWWLFSPKPLRQLQKRIAFWTISSFLFILLVGHPFINSLLGPYPIQWGLYGLLILSLLFFILSPRIESFRAREFAVELSLPPSFEPIPFLATTIEKEIEKLKA